MKNIFNKNFKLIILLIFLAELISFYGYLQPDFRQIAFFIVVGLILILSLIDLKFGVLILLAELFIGSKGYLFYFASGGVVISIRIALWLIIMAVWAGKTLINKNESLRAYARSIFTPRHGFHNPGGIYRIRPVARERRDGFRYKIQLKPYAYFIPLFFFIIWGLISGWLNHNSFNNIFFDFNGWLYFLLLFPLASCIYRDSRLPTPGTGGQVSVHQISQVFVACLAWLSFKTFLLLFIFSHNIIGLTYELYRWVRASGVGEITQMQGGFYRVFFQSHIYILIGLFILLIFLADQTFKDKKRVMGYGLWVTCLLSTIIISFSRSFWVGSIVGLLIYFGFLIKEYNWQKVFKILGLLLLSVITSILVIIAIVNFPYPDPLGGFNTASLLSERLTETNESAISSRWQLLPELWQEIKQTPILGQGFGATVTYFTKDPRVLESNPSGEYTTYAFEWGFLDIWLKLGILGLLAYLVLIGKIVYDGFKKRANSLILGLTIGLIVISAVSFFSPYLNHPLGIGYIILAYLIINAPFLSPRTRSFLSSRTRRVRDL